MTLKSETETTWNYIAPESITAGSYLAKAGQLVQFLRENGGSAPDSYKRMMGETIELLTKAGNAEIHRPAKEIQADPPKVSLNQHISMLSQLKSLEYAKMIPAGSCAAYCIANGILQEPAPTPTVSDPIQRAKVQVNDALFQFRSCSQFYLNESEIARARAALEKAWAALEEIK